MPTHMDRPAHPHTRTRSTHSSCTNTSWPHTHCSGPHKHASVRSCKTEERLKRLLLQSCCLFCSNGTKQLIYRFSIVLLGSNFAERPRDYLPDFATLKPQSTRHRAPPGPHLHRGVQATPLRASQTRTREQTRCRKRTVPYSGEGHFYITGSNNIPI